MRALLAVASVLVALALFELAVRALDLRTATSPYWTFHEVLGWTQMPSRRFEYQVGGQRVTVEINSLGFRDEEHALEKPEGVRRLVVVGDSFSEAIQVDLEQTYFRLLAGTLSERSGDPWEAINLGIGDFGTAQAWLALERYGFAHDPDLVVLQVFPLNDLCNNAIELAGLCKSGNDALRPYFVEREGRLVQTTLQPLRNALRRHSLAFRLLDGSYRYWRQTSDPPGQRPLPASRLEALGLGALPPLLHVYVPEPEQPPVVRRAWSTTERILDALVAACRRRGVPLAVVLAPFEVRLGDRWEGFASARPPPRMHRDEADLRLERFLEERGALVVALRPVFDEHLEEVLPSLGGHFSVGGHRVAAQALADAIEARWGERLGLGPSAGAAAP